MTKIAFIGAGSTIFAKNVLGDCLMVPAVNGFEFALYDIDPKRLKESKDMLEHLKNRYNDTVSIRAYDDRKEALAGAKYVINAIQVGGYKPGTVIDFEIPKKYGLKQTIADTVGIGGIFRALRTIPVLLDMAKDIESAAPDAWLLNYTNPMASLTGALLRYTDVKTVGLCHSVQVCTKDLFKSLGMKHERIEEKIAGINHMAWLLEVKQDGRDLYPEIKKRAKEKQKTKHGDMVRFELMDKFGYYVTESSEHNAEYHPYFIKSRYPELIEELNIPIDEYLRRCEKQIQNWEKMRGEIVGNRHLTHERSNEYGSRIIEAMETGQPFTFGGNVLNKGLITNLPEKAVVEVTCVAERNRITPCYAGELPEQLAALNRTNINTQLLTIEAATTKRKEHIYHAALLDPHTAAELSMDDIVSMCDELIEAHGDWLPEFE
ncbi:alpha-galactosidase MelA [Bacillus licheniformis]|jgi:alpha-galactosidase|uniref:Alpha-D-galactoside galactohydrolase, Glycoside Hydrolase Family 4,MelA n=2 Tax=Bacillus licheniformis TaxID=1402 RepID=Q65LL3_BACLD|nr:MULTISPECIES: alpha-galactosidase MelA [Bacillus]MBJ7888805.1 alpha-glucosidase/alpha-galactosidase [Bacillaceae bacterium HSR45]MBY8349641.1 alpha-glucosidase/alpha-galactosidase [Bacillus sp. PCH94]MDP4080525.1 alpha-galactosidase MelA [Bacillota bacterium]AAU22704.1 alpha-D-galactoside galactohydrolase, Glycoside Hydrolase Family 4,MelA [Bacillus licheniformis DSM 13 = ATCC 14580]AAU40051.1 alpha-galactosidase MelA [Bacillus licheniformis DSM 13 = ATCC 14580]